MLSLDSDPKLEAFITKHNIVAIKHNEREWGSYELVLAIGEKPTHGFVIPNMVWGYAIPMTIAIQDVLRNIAGKTDDPYLQWLGQERMDELTGLMT